MSARLRENRPRCGFAVGSLCQNQRRSNPRTRFMGLSGFKGQPAKTLWPASISKTHDGALQGLCRRYPPPGHVPHDGRDRLRAGAVAPHPDVPPLHSWHLPPSAAAPHAKGPGLVGMPAAACARVRLPRVYAIDARAPAPLTHAPPSKRVGRGPGNSLPGSVSLIRA